jgi:hypothetical protein
VYSLPILNANTVVNPWTVVVEYLDTLVTLSAVLSPDRSHRLACVTDVVHWIVDVIVVTPGCWITNLKDKAEYKGLISFSYSDGAGMDLYT